MRVENERKLAGEEVHEEMYRKAAEAPNPPILKTL